MDDFFVPYKHNFHPRDVIYDIRKLGGEILYFDNDMREYNHESKKYFTIGGDRIYIKKKRLEFVLKWENTNSQDLLR